MRKVEVTFHEDRFWIGKYEIRKSGLGWHLLNENGELVVAYSDIEDAARMAEILINKEQQQ